MDGKRAVAWGGAATVLFLAGACSQPESRRDWVERRMRDVTLVRHARPAAPAKSMPRGVDTAKVALGALPGRWNVFDSRSVAGESGGPDAQDIEKLESMAYASGYRAGPTASGVTRFDAERAHSGWNLYVSGHAPEAILIDMEGRVLHKWGMDLLEAMPSYRVRLTARVPNHWRRAHLAPNGDVIAIYDGYGMVKVDHRSNLLWSLDDHIHHDLEVLPDGTIYTLVRKGERIDALNDRGTVVMDSILLLDREGREIRRVSVFDCFAHSDYSPLIEWMPRERDVLHTNTIEVFDGSLAHLSPRYAAGNVLLSFRHLDTVAIVDLEEERVIWARWGVWSSQHQPVLLPDGNMLLFDNRGLGARSRVLEFEPISQEILWRYGEERGQEFYTRLLGSVQRLPNGNTLISESDNGRAFEVTREGDVVWEFVNPHRAGESDELIASLFELVRLERDTPLDWADPTTAALSIDVSETSR